MMTLLDRFQDYVKRHELFTRQDKILLTVSGGVDSMVLMSLCVNSGYNVGIAHCNFGLRGQESDEDEIMVQETARRYGIECHNKRFDTTGEMDRTGESMEMAARRLRYAWFNQLCEEFDYTVIAIAHHVDDSIETFFINMLRGTGLRGLTGISKQVGNIVRPLMFATRKEILEYAHQKHISFREDSSNLSTKYLRNKIRLGIIPRMREINQRFSFIMQRNVDRLTAAQRFIDGAIDNIFAQAAEFNGDICTLHIDRIENISSRDFVIYEMLNSRFGFKGDTVDNLCKALKAGNAGKRFYSRNYVAYVDRGNIAVAPIEENDLCEMTIREGQHRAYCGNSLLYFDICDVDSLDTFHVPDNVALLDIEKITFPLTLRRWKDGDTFIPFGMNGRKKVSDYLIDHKVSMAEKERQFVLLSDDEIAWLIGHRTSDNFRITDKTDKVLRVTRENIY
jgi:tRNA(Ile)-lysidine synthase